MTVTGREHAAGQLFIVSTPIGNMGDFSFRAVETLRAVELVLAEDTRHSRHLLDRHGIATPLQPYHEHNEARSTPVLVAKLLDGASMALVSDAGTPLLSDPGERLVRAAIEAGVRVVPVPGASALLAALVVAGLDASRFTFFGFLPRKGRERDEALRDVVASRWTLVLYEAPARVEDTLDDLARAGLSTRRVVVARELTKQFEDIRRGTAGELAAYYRESPPRGEVVMVIEGVGAPPAADEADVRARARSLRADGLGARDTAARLVEEFEVPRNAAYRIAQEEGSG